MIGRFFIDLSEVGAHKSRLLKRDFEIKENTQNGKVHRMRKRGILTRCQTL